MADGSVSIVVNANADKAEKKLDKVARKIESIEGKIRKANDLRSPLAEQAAELSAELDKANAKLYEMQQATPGQYTTKQLADQKELVQSLSGQYNRVQAQVEKYDRQIKNANYDLDRAKERYGELALQISHTSGIQERMAEAVEKMQKRAEKFANRIRSLLRRVLFFGLISRGLSSFQDWLGKTIQQNDEASAAIARLKGALLTLAQPILNVAVPAFTVLVNALTKVVTAIAEFISILFGSSLAESKKAAESLNNEKNALDGVGSAAKDAEKSMAAFDEINQLTAANAAGGAGGASSGIAADFDSLVSALPGWLANMARELNKFAGDLKIKIKDLKFDWDRGNILKNKDAWIVALSAILGAVLGSMFGGLTGGVIGLLLGAAIGLITATWTDKLENPERAKNLAIIALSALIGASLGKIFGGFAGGVIGLLVGASIGLIAVEFLDGKFDKWSAKDTFGTVITAILGAVLGGIFGGLKGAVIGLLLGASISVLSVAFEDELKNAGLSKEGFFQLMGILLGTIIGPLIFKGLTGTIIGLTLGTLITLISIAFDENASESSKTTAKAMLGVIMTTLIFAALGGLGFGPAGAIAGGIIGLTAGTLIQIIKLDFDDSVSEGTKRQAGAILQVILDGLLGAAIGAALGGGVFGGIVGGIVGIGLGLAIHWTDITYEDLPTQRKGFGGSRKTASSGTMPYAASAMPPVSTVQLPRLASGAVIPPNREFMAVLGDQKSGTNIETPLSTMVQAFKQAMNENGGVNARQMTVVLQLDRRELGRAVYQLNNEESQRVGVRLAGVKA